MGRPTLYSDDLARKICAQIANGRALAHVCKQRNMPSIATVLRWIASREDFRASYERARAASADLYAERIIDIANATLAGEVDPSAAKVAIDALKWTASKLKPKVYGDNRHLDVNATVTDGTPTTEAPAWVKALIEDKAGQRVMPPVIDAEPVTVEAGED